MAVMVDQVGVAVSRVVNHEANGAEHHNCMDELQVHYSRISLRILGAGIKKRIVGDCFDKTSL